MPDCAECGCYFGASFDEQRYCWDCWKRGPATPRRARRGDYDEYLESLDWRLQRTYRIAFAGGRCERCDATRALQPHHITYDRRGNEFLEDLEVLCRPCHEAEHGIAVKEKPMSADNAKATAATITTTGAQVAISTLTVNGRSMTLAVFRQLPERALIDDAALNGTPWGIVNLCPSRDCPDPDSDREARLDHRHVIWEADGQLYRDIARPPFRFEPYSDWGEAWAVLAAADLRRRHITWNAGSGSPQSCRIVFAEGVPAVRCALPYDDYDLRGAVSETKGKPEPPPCNCKSYGSGAMYHRDCGATWRKAQDLLNERAAVIVDELASDFGADTAPALLQAVGDRIERELRDVWARHLPRRARWDDVKALPQLFLGT